MKKRPIYYHRRIARIIWNLMEIIVMVTAIGIALGAVFGFASAATYFAAIRTLCLAAVVAILDAYELVELYPGRKW